MKENFIRGKYLEIDFNNQIITHQNDVETIREILKNIVNQKNTVYIKRYDQGFLDINDPETLDNLPSILTTQLIRFIDTIKSKMSLNKLICDFMKLLEDESIYDEDVIDYVWEILDEMQTTMHFKTIKNDPKIVIKLNNYQPKHLLDLPKNVIGVLFECRPSSLEIAILDSKLIAYLVSNGIYKVGHKYKFLKYDQGLLPGLEIEDLNLTRCHRGKFQLGLSIHEISQIDMAKDIDPNYIIVEPEKSYIQTCGIACVSIRQVFYKKLYETFPNTDILITLPKLELLDVYFNQGNSTSLDSTTILNHSSIYETELKSAFKIPNNRVFITIPDIEDVNEFNQIKRYLEHLSIKRFGSRLKIGLEVNTEYCSLNLSLFKGFEYAVIDLDKRFELLLPDEVNSIKYALQHSDLRNILYRKSKRTYVMGKDLCNPDFLQKLIYRGFRKFTIKPELFPLYSEIIYRYNQGERLYGKTV
ncbi:hypothetical protein [Acholeplasma laidlawii]|uniref:hypothetical protein n=1 Tax=Acholeplasma laidlawii TaxID=2148 RepID=UPI0021F74DAE|nr:hypothetical protein [Acholeplasma laidlawii]